MTETVEAQAVTIEVQQPEAKPIAVAQTQAVATSQSAPSNLMQALIVAASDPSVDIARMERLFEMHQKVTRYQAEIAFNDAMSRAQSRILPIVRNKWNSQTNSGYADLSAINEQIVPIYTAEGLSISFGLETKNDENPVPAHCVRVIATIAHAQGHSKREHYDVPLDDSGAQGRVNKTKVHAGGSSVSYGRRYLTCMIFNIATMDDNDGNGQRSRRGKQANTAPENAPQDMPLSPPAKPYYDDAQITANLPEWRELVSTGTKTAARIVQQLELRYTITETQRKRIEDELHTAEPKKAKEAA